MILCRFQQKSTKSVLFFSAGISLIFHILILDIKVKFSRINTSEPPQIYLTLLLKEHTENLSTEPQQTTTLEKAPIANNTPAWNQIPEWINRENRNLALIYWPEKEVDQPANWLVPPDFEITDLKAIEPTIATITLKIDATGLVTEVVIEAPELTEEQIQTLRLKMFKSYFIPAKIKKNAVNSTKVITLHQNDYTEIPVQ